MTTTPAMPELPEPELGYVKTDKSNQPAFSARQMRAALQAQPAEVAVSDEDIWRLWDSQDSPELSGGPCPVKFARAILALRTQADSSDEQVREAWIAVVDTLDEVLGREWRRSHETLLESAVSAIRSLRPQAVPMTEGWQEVAACPDGDVWFSLSCGHVVMGWKQGPLLLDWEAAVDHDCCSDASAIKAMPVTPPAHHGITAPAGGEVK